MMLKVFIDRVDNFYGWTVLSQWVQGEDWTTAGLFPRVTYCDLSERILGNQLRHYTMQCVLSINMINEKFFTFLWWWVLLVTLISAFSLISWCDRVFFPFSRYNFISSYLESAPEWQTGEEKSLIEEVTPDRRATRLKQRVYAFVYSFLGQDGVFLLRLVAWNSGVGVTSALAATLYNEYRKVKKAAKRADQEEEPKKGLMSDTNELLSKVHASESKV